MKDLQKHIPIPYAFNVKNTIHLMKDLMNIQYNSNIKLASFDITNMYTNIPTNGLPNIIHNLCSNNHVNPSTQTELLHLVPLSLIKIIFNLKTPFSYKTQV